MFAVAILVCLGVAGIGGWRSFTAVSLYFGSWTVPVIADGLVVGTTAIRLAALTRGWRVPGSVLLTLFSLGGTVWLNIHASRGNGTAQFSHAMAPVAYLLLMEMLAYVLKLQLKLQIQAKARLTLLGWVVSPVITTRAWLLMSRTGEKDPTTARAAIQQSIRARSQLLIICPSAWWSPLDAARRARSAALQTVRDGLLTAADVVKLLPAGDTRMEPVTLLMAINSAALLPRLPVEVELAQALEAAQAETVRVREEAAAELVRVTQAAQVEATRFREEAGVELARARTQTASEAEAQRAEAVAGLQHERDRHRAELDQVAAAAESEREALRAQLLGEITDLQSELAAARAPEPEPPGGGLKPGAADVDQDNDAARGRRRVATGEPDKKTVFTAAVMEKLAADLEAGQRSELLADNAEVRNAVMYPLADAIPLHRGSARTYLQELLPELNKIAREYRPGLTLLPPSQEEEGDADDEAAAG